MFTDKRSKKIIFVSHCILNQNSISDSTADFPSQFKEITNLIMNNDIGIVQLRCPEMFCLGLNRNDDQGAKRNLLTENSRIRECLETNENILKIHGYVQEIIREIKEYIKYGFTIIGILGVNRSPSCGVNTTSKGNEEIKGMGVLMNILNEELKNEGIHLPMIGTKTSQVSESVELVKQLIDKEV